MCDLLQGNLFVVSIPPEVTMLTKIPPPSPLIFGFSALLLALN